MVKFDVLAFRDGFVCMILMVDACIVIAKLIGDFTFLKMCKGKLPLGNYKNKAEWRLMRFLTWMLLIAMATGGIIGMVSNLNPELEIVKGTAISVKKELREHFELYKGTIELLDEEGKKVNIEQVFFMHRDVEQHQLVEILVVKLGNSDNILIKSNGKYTETYKRYYWSMEKVTQTLKRFLLIYISFGTLYSLWQIWKTGKALRGETKQFCYLKGRRVKRYFVSFVIGCFAYRAGLVFLLLNRYQDASVMKVVLPLLYLFYKGSYFKYFTNRYRYIILEAGNIVIKRKWEKDRIYSVTDCLFKKTVCGRYVKIKFPDRRRCFLNTRNETAQQLAQYVN